eukprot:8536667-Pyramimonas_sp.AAC.1
MTSTGALGPLLGRSWAVSEPSWGPRLRSTVNPHSKDGQPSLGYPPCILAPSAYSRGPEEGTLFVGEGLRVP